MEFQDIISSSLRKDMKELQQFQERLKEIKEECNTNIQRLKRNFENINPESTFWTIRDFHVLFGKEFNSFREGFVRVIYYLELQLATEEVHECNSKKCVTVLKKQFEKFLDDTSDCKNEERVFQEFLQEKNYVVNTQGFRDMIIHLLEGNAQRAKQSKKKCLIHFRLLHTLLEDFSKEDLTNACFSSAFHQAFSSLFGEDVEYFAPRLFFNMDKLEKQLNAEEFNEEIAMVVFKVLKNQLQQFITMQISMDSDDQKTNHFFTEYTLCDAQMFHNILVSLMDSIEKAITERGLYKRVHDSRVNERTMQTHKGMISKDASEIDNNVAGASHDKDNIIEEQGSNNEMFEENLTKTKNASEMFEETKTDHKKLTEENVLLKKEIETENKRKMGLGYTDPCPLGKAIVCHPKLYDAEVLGLHYVKPNVYDIEEILNDAKRVKSK
ncbi:hypothetical protein Tco_0226922 [Tanacetum coccineum]